ncbi:pseudouridine-5'-phosphate glycosidase [Marinihelvus fidelis]|uniref:Pseudouridine-5'-phosphate glycosidase n=1 Tax=Marinihelvus fidelis TaxID=2613842 RepID=A0A5N0TDT3_9GAMM|nr:pseudouridine-5'-phosphate glycosidase [Marinihelvus fidelis]KAA9131459.1 pseudouridine-5'-phosphate glycosidase [Marinihelvus fidelis]
MSDKSLHLRTSEAVSAALNEGRPVVALESTIITHGLPAPHNLETARATEQAVIDAGVVPATIAIIDGRIHVGLDDAQLERLARAGEDVDKCSRRDLAAVLQRGGTAGTTVATTMIVAAMAGIRVFATGGIGGVHPGAHRSFDISADLKELARTPVAVVCAGPKSILDIGLTLEYLETHGVPVVTVGSDTLPAFYSRDSGFPASLRLDDPAAIADMLRLQWQLGLDGVVIANPIDAEYALGVKTMAQVNETAVREAIEAGVSGKALTPFLLARVEALTGGQSLQANQALIVSNARLAAEIARQL